MRAVRCVVNFNEILQKEVGLEEMWATVKIDTVKEKCVKAHQNVAEQQWHRSAKAGHYSHPTAAPQQQALSYPKGSLLFLPWESPNQTVWMTAGLLVYTM